jgi:hypothetical protein
MLGFKLPLSRILLAETQNGRQSFVDAPLAALLVARPAPGAEFVNVTPQHTV